MLCRCARGVVRAVELTGMFKVRWRDNRKRAISLTTPTQPSVLGPRCSLFACLFAVLLTSGCVDLSVLRWGSGAGDDLAYVGADDNVYSIDPAAPAGAAAEPRQITHLPGTGSTSSAPNNATHDVAIWPTLSPDGRRIVYMLGIVQGDAVVQSGIYVANADGSQAVQIWHSESDMDGPIYAAWSPDSASLALLTSENNDVVLRVTGTIGAQPAATSIVDRGGSIYFSWSPDGHRLIVHTDGGSPTGAVRLVSLANHTFTTERIPVTPTDFRAPAWSPTGTAQIYAGAGGPGVDRLYWRQASDGQARSLGSFGPTAAFAWSPDGKRLAVARASSDPFNPLYTELLVLDPSTGGEVTIASEEHAAFFWSPDGRQIAYLRLEPPTSVQWVVVDANGQNRHALDSFAPDQAFQAMLPFFDQYAESESVWSPDGRYLVGTGWRDVPAGPDAQPRVLIFRADGSQPIRDVAQGSEAFWRRIRP